MAPLAFPSRSSMQHVFRLWLLASFCTSVIGFSLSSDSAVFGWSHAGSLSPPMQGLGKLLHDTWVDTHVTAPFSSTGSCNHSKTVGDVVGEFGEKLVLMLGGLSDEGWRRRNSSFTTVAADYTSIEAEGKFAQDIKSTQLQSEYGMEKMALETKAVYLSVFVQNSCMESGPWLHRRCWRNFAQASRQESRASLRELAPVTVKFTESRKDRTAFRAKQSSIAIPRELAPVTILFTEPQSARKITAGQMEHHAIRTPLVSSLRPFRLGA